MTGVILKDNAAVATFCAEAEAAPWLALDTEFRREDTYWPQWCLLQLAIPSQIAFIDPIAHPVDMTPLKVLLTAPVLKIMHAPRQDLEVLYQELGIIPKPLFDTQLAASFCGFGDYVGYDKLVAAVLGKRVDKSERVTDWSRRPLTEAQLAYAANDVRHLDGLYTSLQARLAKRGRLDWLAAETQSLCALETFTPNPAEAWQRLRIGSVPEPVLAKIQHLAVWREENAIRLNVPRLWLMKDDALLQLARKREAKPRDLRGHLMPPHRDNPALVESLQTCLSQPLALLQPAAAMSDTLLNAEETLLLEGLKLLLKYIAQRQEIAPRLLATNKDLLAVLRQEPAAERLFNGWVGEVLGAPLKAFLRGERALHVEGGVLQLIEISS